MVNVTKMLLLLLLLLSDLEWLQAALGAGRIRWDWVHQGSVQQDLEAWHCAVQQVRPLALLSVSTRLHLPTILTQIETIKAETPARTNFLHNESVDAHMAYLTKKIGKFSFEKNFPWILGLEITRMTMTSKCEQFKCHPLAATVVPYHYDNVTQSTF